MSWEENSNKNTKKKLKSVLSHVAKFIFGKNIYQNFLRVYLFLVVVGSLLLYFDISHIPDTKVKYTYTYWTALFVACSAFSNTGLTPIEIYSFYNILGQSVILFLIWSGGIGIISVFFLLWNWLRKESEFKYKELLLLKEERGEENLLNTFRLIKFSTIFITLTQLFFAILISFWICFFPAYNQISVGVIDGVEKKYMISWDDKSNLLDTYHNFPLALWHGLFCSCSAMNNAGFELFSSINSNYSLSPFRNDWNVIFQLLVSIEIIIGGIGFPLIFDVYEKYRLKKKHMTYKFTLFTKVCLISYIIVFIISTGSALSFEFFYTNKSYFTNFNNTCDEWTIMNSPNEIVLDSGVVRPWGWNPEFNKVCCIIFNSINTRSAGFSTVNQGLLTEGSRIIFTLSMFVGTSPSSTGGGIRTTTLAILTCYFVATLFGKKNINLFKRRIPEETVMRSLFVFVAGIFLMLISSVIIFHTRNIYDKSMSVGETLKWHLTPIIYEICSAFGTVGLSTGVVGKCDELALFILTILMFIGQLGVSSTLLAWRKNKNSVDTYSYGYEDIKIG